MSTSTKKKIAKHPDELRIYRGKDGWRYTEWKDGEIVDASTQGYSRRIDCVKNLVYKRTCARICYGWISDNYPSFIKMGLVNVTPVLDLSKGAE